MVCTESSTGAELFELDAVLKENIFISESNDFGKVDESLFRNSLSTDVWNTL